MELADLKKAYGELARKYKMPGFQELNENFEIEKIDKESECLLRLIRKVMLEKIVNSFNFAEFLLNPLNAPKMYLPFIKTMTLDDRKEIEKIYSGISELLLQTLDIEVDYSEKKEAEMIKKMLERWNELKPSFRKIFANMKKPNRQNGTREKSYFG
jgi:hypothetical protein